MPCPSLEALQTFLRVTLTTRRRPLLGYVLASLLILVVSGTLAEGLNLGQSVVGWVGQQYGVAARVRVERLQTLVRLAGEVKEKRKLEQVNTFFNAIPYDSDWDLWNKEDYWATPIEMLGIDGADCEDYAIAKYFTLRELGVPAKRLRITYVKALTLNQAHMVLAYYPSPSAEPLILDNLETTIRSAGERDDLVPVYSFNGESLWLAKNRHRGVKVGGSGRIKLWNNLRRKMAEEKKR